MKVLNISGALNVVRVFDKERGFLVDGGKLTITLDIGVIEVFGAPAWLTDGGSIPNIPVVSYLIPWFGTWIDIAYLVHDALWQDRLLHGYDKEFTNQVLVAIAEYLLKEHCKVLPWYRKAWCQSYGWAQIQLIDVGLSTKTATYKWNHPDAYVKTWTTPIVRIKGNDNVQISY